MDIPKDISELAVRMRFMSSVTKGMLMNVKSRTLVLKDSWFSTYVRMKDGESRWSTLAFIEDLARDLFHLYRYHRKSEWIARVDRELADVLRGIENVRWNYQDSIDVVSHLDPIIDSLAELVRERELVLGGMVICSCQNEDKIALG